MIKNSVKFILALLIASLAMLAVRAWAFTIFTVPSSEYTPEFNKGDRVIVNRLTRMPYQRGDNVVYDDSTSYRIGQIIAVPGDTITLNSERYVIPHICCKRCRCTDCKYYLVKSGKRKALVHKHQFTGRAYRLFNLEF